MGMSLLWFLIIGLLAGWIASGIVKDSGRGMVWNLMIGVVGSFVGGGLFSLLGIGTSSKFGSLVTAVIGAIILLWLVNWINKKRIKG